MMGVCTEETVSMHLNGLPERERRKIPVHEMKTDTASPIPPSPLTVIPIKDRQNSNNQTRSGRVIRKPNHYGES